MTDTPPALAWVAASVPKSGNRPDENEDATAADPAGMRFAIADGATEGWQSGGWATHLATAFVRQPPTPADFPNWLAAARRGWTPPSAAGAVPWYAEVKQEQGSFATLVGVEFRKPKEGPGLAWKAVAVGDSCLLVVRGGRVETSFPLSSGDGFGSRPRLIPSGPVPCPKPEWLAGRAQPGDLVLLATDAVAARLLGLATPDRWAPALAAIADGLTSSDPKPLLEFFSSSQPALNDDCTLLAVRVPELPPESTP